MEQQVDYWLEDTRANFLSVHFPSAIELLDYRPKLNDHNDQLFDKYLNSTAHQSRRKWIGPTAKSNRDVVERALIGDHELYKRHMMKMVAELRKSLGQHTADYKQVIQTSKRKPEFGSFGDEVDIHKVYQGQLDSAWRRTHRIEVAKETKLVTLFIQVSGTFSVDAIQSMWRGAAAILLMEDLLKAGKSVKIVVGGYSVGVTRKKQHGMTVSIVVKEYNEKLSVERLAAMTHLGFYRTFCFAAKAAQPYELDWGLGATSELHPEHMPIQFRDDVHKGHSKFVVLQRSLSLHAARDSVIKAQEKMKEFQNEDFQAK